MRVAWGVATSGNAPEDDNDDDEEDDARDDC